ncbi:hypothetical protein CRENBAI_002216 [Crenichthys baileyi]|uniref:Uncharacterized protein n=1 Tax=Crenichthys baileyi TaxID=28760 RepID=A0AAV9RH56_9TELE
MNSYEMRLAFENGGFKLTNKLYQMLIARYADNEIIDFDNFTCCLVKLETMFKTFQALDRDGTGTVEINLIEERYLHPNRSETEPTFRPILNKKITRTGNVASRARCLSLALGLVDVPMPPSFVGTALGEHFASQSFPRHSRTHPSTNSVCGCVIGVPQGFYISAVPWQPGPQFYCTTYRLS